MPHACTHTNTNTRSRPDYIHHDTRRLHDSKRHNSNSSTLKITSLTLSQSLPSHPHSPSLTPSQSLPSHSHTFHDLVYSPSCEYLSIHLPQQTNYLCMGTRVQTCICACDIDQSVFDTKQHNQHALKILFTNIIVLILLPCDHIFACPSHVLGVHKLY